MSRSAAAILILFAATAVLAQSPQPTPSANPSANPSALPWVVTVVHTIDLQKMVNDMRVQQKLRVGVAGTAPPYIYNVTTGIVIDDRGHVVTRLANLDPQEKEHKLAVTTSDGTTLPAKFIGVDFATGFAVLEVGSLSIRTPNIAVSSSLLNGAQVKILSSDVRSRSTTNKVYLTPSINVSQGHLMVDSIYSRARGTLTLLSDNLLARSDSSVVVTPENQVVGIAQYAGFGRAYLYPIELIRDTVAKRVLDKQDNVPAGWLGMTGDSVAQLSDAEIGTLGLDRKAGVIVREVTAQSGAAQAGLMLSDVITRVDDFDIAGAADLKALLSSLPAGQPIKLRAIRAHKPVELTAVLGPRPYSDPGYLPVPFDQNAQPVLADRDQLEKRLQELGARLRSYQNSPPSREANEAVRELSFEIRQIHDSIRALGPDTRTLVGSPGQPGAASEPYAGGNLTGESQTDTKFAAGFTARDLTAQLAAVLEARGGVWVSDVAKNSPADRSGLKAGDVIVGTQDRVLLRAAQLQVLLSSQRGPIALSVVRNKATIVVNLNLH